MDRADERVVGVMATHGLGLLRISLGVVFIWFGLLKVIGVTPVADLVTAVITWIPAALSVPLVGLFEVVLGVGLVVGYGLRFTLLLLWLHLAGTFLLLLVRPDLTFQSGNPLFLTADGEFVIKNLVLISGGIAVGSTVRRQRESLSSNVGFTA
ncbi:MAG: DoxX family membrane protein [Candidatus Bathyarchaeia archaeon]